MGVQFDYLMKAVGPQALRVHVLRMCGAGNKYEWGACVPGNEQCVIDLRAVLGLGWGGGPGSAACWPPMATYRRQTPMGGTVDTGEAQ